MASFRFKSDTSSRDLAIARFKKSGGQPPQGVKLLGRWTAVDLSGGSVLVESTDARALAEFALHWSDLLELQITPVVDDLELMDVLNRPYQP